jgi:sugar phosphate isomerase/epimerase
MTFPAHFTIISDEVSQELPVLTAFVREFNLPGLELRSFNGRAFKDLTGDDIATIAKASRDGGWRIFGCSTPVFKCGLDDAAAIREHREIFQRSLETARALNCDLVRIFTFLRQPNPLGDGRQQRVTEHLLGLVDLAKGSGVRLGIENEHSCLVATADELLAVLAGLPADRVGAIWDPCNVLYVPGASAPTATDIPRLAPRLFHVHVKDAVERTHAPAAGELRAVGMPIGAGQVGWREHLQALQQAGYPGMLSLETHWRLQKIDESMLHLPAGHAFSHGGEPASRICLHILKAIADTL